MANYNRIIIIGNLTRDPELKQLQSGQSVCKLNLASNRKFKNKTGVLVQEVCYIDVDVWGALADSCNQHLRKGRPVLVEGRLKQDTWKEADGQARSKHAIVADSVVFLGTSQTAEAGVEGGAEETNDFMASPSRRMQGPAAKPDAQQSPMVGGSALFKDEPPFEDDLPF